MIRAKELHGRSVIDLDTAQKLGDVHEVILDPETRQVAAIVAAAGQTFMGGGDRIMIPAGAVHAIGEDAITVSRSETGGGAAGAEIPSTALDALPRLSHITGRKVVTESGKVVGEIDDVLLDGDSGRILGYAMGGGHRAGGLGEMFAAPKAGGHDRVFEYVRAESDVRVGPDVVVVPDDAVVREERHEARDEQRATATSAPATPVAYAGPTMHEPLGRTDAAVSPGTTVTEPMAGATSPTTRARALGQTAVPFTNSSGAPRTSRWSSWAAPEGYTSPWTRREETVRTESHTSTPSSVDTGRMP